MVRRFLFTLLLAAALASAVTLDLYYTQDGRKIESIRGYAVNKDMTVSEEGDESWLVAVGYQVGPNGYMDKQSKLTVGTLGKKTAAFVPADNFLGIGLHRRFERAVSVSDVVYILPNPKPMEPAIVHLNDDTEWELFVNGDYTECTGEKKVGDRIDNDLFVVKLKYNIPKSQRTPSTRPQQMGIKAKAVAFSEAALRQALRKMKF